jgi:hypothetical protein
MPSDAQKHYHESGSTGVQVAGYPDTHPDLRLRRLLLSLPRGPAFIKGSGEVSRGFLVS